MVSRKKGIYGLIVMGIITALFASQLPYIKFNYDFTKFFPQGDSDLAYYERITDEFGMYDDFLYVALFHDDVYDRDFLDKVDSLTSILESWPEIDQVLSPTNQVRYQITPFGINRLPLFKRGKGMLPENIDTNEQFKGLYFANDSRSVGLIVRHQNYVVKSEGDAFYRKFMEFLEASGFEDNMVSGKIQAQDEFVQRLESDLGFNLAMALMLVILTLVLIFRTFRGVWIPLLTLLITTVWNIGLYGLIGKELDVLMVIIPPILLIVAMSDLIHLCNKFNDLIRQGLTSITALNITVKEVGLATFFTSLTTAIGFFSLVVLPVKPIRDFGLYTGLGILLAFLIAFSLIPCLLAINGKPLNNTKGKKSLWDQKLASLFVWTMRRKQWIIGSSVFLLVISLTGSTLVKENTSILVGVQKDDPLAAPVLFFDEQYDGYKPFEMTLEMSGNESIFSIDVLEDLEALHDHLHDSYGVRHIQSPLTIIKSLNQALKGGASSAYKIPEEKDLSKLKRLFFSSRLNDLREFLQSKDGSTWRLNGRSKDLGSSIALQKNNDLVSFIKTLQNAEITYRLTGTAHLIDITNSFNVRAILSGLLIAIAVIGLVIMLAARSIKLMLISLIPNLLPLLAVGALMGILKVDLNLSTAIIYSVAFGIAVDDSIHFLSRYLLEIRKGRSSIYALKRTFLSTGKSIILTTAVLLAGFSIFLNSGFSATYYIGFFVCTTLIIALLADLLLLPVLLHQRRKT